MTENTTMTQVADTTSSRGAQWAGAGSLIALAAQSLLGNRNGGLLSSILGNGSGGNSVGESLQNSAMCALMDENTQLKADAATDRKIAEVYTLLREQDKAQDKFTYDLDKRLSAVETAAPLREQIVIDRINSVAQTAQTGISANANAIGALAATVAGITKTVVPNSSICPGWGSVTVSPSPSGTLF